jgi:hypothetical protein
MKKIILFILLNFLTMNVYAETFYTDYSLIESNSLQYNEDYATSDLYKIVKKLGYNNYKIIKTNEGYYQRGHAPSSLKYYDINDTIEGIIYQKSPINGDYTQYRTNSIFKATAGRYIAFKDFASNGTPILNEITITYNDQKIDYTFIENNYTFGDTLEYENWIGIDLGAFYDLKYLKIKMTFTEETLSYIDFMLYVYHDEYGTGNHFTYYDQSLLRYNSEETYYVDFIEPDLFQELLTKTYWIKSSDYANKHSVSYYKGIGTLYKYYTPVKEYLDIYTEEPIDGYLLDKSKSASIYDYYYRDYIEVKDNLETKSDIQNIIISSSIPVSDINVSLYINDKDNKEAIAVINYQKNTFFKKLTISNDEILEEVKNQIESGEISNQVVSTQIIENQTVDEITETTPKENSTNPFKNKIKKDNNTQTKLAKESIESSITENITNANETTKKINYDNKCNTEKYQKYLYILIFTNLITLLLLVFIMCKYLKKIPKK